MLIPGMSIALPGALTKGDRPIVSAWRLIAPPKPGDFNSEETTLERAELPAMPSAAFNPHGVELGAVSNMLDTPRNFKGWIVDATEIGLDIRLQSITPYLFGLSEPLLIRVTMPAEAGRDADGGSVQTELVFIAEIRPKRAVGDNGCRLGVVMLGESDMKLSRTKRNVLRKYLADIQREHLWNSRDRAG